MNGIQEVRGSIPLSSTSFVGLWRSLVARFLGVEEVVGSNPASPTKFGVWLSLVERTVRDREVAGSNPVTPTTTKRDVHAHVPLRNAAAAETRAPHLPRSGGMASCCVDYAAAVSSRWFWDGSATIRPSGRCSTGSPAVRICAARRSSSSWLGRITV